VKAPTAAELRNHPTVQSALSKAWNDSLPHDPDQRHEEGGWIYINLINLVTEEITVECAPGGLRALIDLNSPPFIAGSVLVGKFHTHPNPTDEGWEAGPSESDLRIDDLHGVPDLIQADNGIYVSGPGSRKGGLHGKPGSLYESVFLYRNIKGLTTMATTTVNALATQPLLASDQVLKIARLDAEHAYLDLTPYRISIALEGDGWHIDY
jgi:hypothetical protein